MPEPKTEPVKEEKVAKAKPDYTAMNLHQKLCAITAELAPIDKSGRNSEQGYNFIEYAAVASQIRQLFGRYGVMCYPLMKTDSIKMEAVQTKNGRGGYHCTVVFDFTFTNADTPAETMVISWIGEATDFGDKAINKAATAALKYCLMRTFNVSEKGEQEADANTPEHEPPKRQMTVQSAMASISAALTRKGIETQDDRKKIVLSIAGVKDSSQLTAAHLKHVISTVDDSSSQELKGYLEADKTEEAVKPATQQQRSQIERLLKGTFGDLDQDGIAEQLQANFGVADPQFMSSDEAESVLNQLEGGKK